MQRNHLLIGAQTFFIMHNGMNPSDFHITFLYADVSVEQLKIHHFSKYLILTKDFFSYARNNNLAEIIKILPSLASVILWPESCVEEFNEFSAILQNARAICSYGDKGIKEELYRLEKNQPNEVIDRHIKDALTIFVAFEEKARAEIQQYIYYPTYRYPFSRIIQTAISMSDVPSNIYQTASNINNLSPISSSAQPQSAPQEKEEELLQVQRHEQLTLMKTFSMTDESNLSFKITFVYTELDKTQLRELSDVRYLVLTEDFFEYKENPSINFLAIPNPPTFILWPEQYEHKLANYYDCLPRRIMVCSYAGGRHKTLYRGMESIHIYHDRINKQIEAIPEVLAAYELKENGLQKLHCITEQAAPSASPILLSTPSAPALPTSTYRMRAQLTAFQPTIERSSALQVKQQSSLRKKLFEQKVKSVENGLMEMLKSDNPPIVLDAETIAHQMLKAKWPTTFYEKLDNAKTPSRKFSASVSNENKHVTTEEDSERCLKLTYDVVNEALQRVKENIARSGKNVIIQFHSGTKKLTPTGDSLSYRRRQSDCLALRTGGEMVQLDQKSYDPYASVAIKGQAENPPKKQRTSRNFISPVTLPACEQSAQSAVRPRSTFSQNSPERRTDIPPPPSNSRFGFVKNAPGFSVPRDVQRSHIHAPRLTRKDE